VSSPPHSETDLLLAHGAWIRALARRLVADEHHAEDLAQETWLAALRRRGNPVRAFRPYLAGVLSNLTRQTLRSRARREDTERGAARDVEIPSAAATVEAAALGRDLAGRVLELDEPFRTAILLRYYEDLPPRAIARRTGVPVRTVNSRIARGLERLRTRLRRDRTLAVILLARRAGVAWMNAKQLAAIGVAIAVAAGVLVWMRPPVPDPVAAGTRADLPSTPLEKESPLAAATSAAEGARAPAAPPAPRDERAGSPAPAALRKLRGRVLDVEAVPRAGVEVAFRGGASNVAPRAVSGVGGRFELDVPPADGIVTATDPRLVNVCVGIVRVGREVEPLVVVAPGHDLAGRVVDASGAPLVGAEVSLDPPDGFMRRFDAVLDSTRRFEARATTDASGAFALPGVPELALSRVSARLDGFATAGVDAPPGNDAHLLIQLAPIAAEGGTLEGTVLDESDRAVAGARVSLGQLTAVTDSSGAFRLSTAGAEDAVELVAIHPGHLPGRARAERDPASGKPAWPRVLVLRLGGEPFKLTGRVVDGEGVPRVRLRVWIEDPTRFGILGVDDVATVESMLFEGVGGGDDFWRWCETDADGRFALGGLLDREYRIGMIDEHTLETARVGPYPGGARDVEIVFTRTPVRKLAGRVLSSRGNAVAGATVSLMAHTFGGVSTAIDDGRRVSDADGKYAFEKVGGSELELWVQGDDIVPQLVHVPASSGDQAFDVTVEVRCHFKVVLTQDAKLADGFRVLDAEGGILDLLEIAPGGVLTGKQGSLIEGRSPALGVVDRASTLVLLQGGAEVRRISIRLVPGTLNRIEI
jgi:RNA polymerase sigma-70 factor (ECF subfamily)